MEKATWGQAVREALTACAIWALITLLWVFDPASLQSGYIIDIVTLLAIAGRFTFFAILLTLFAWMRNRANITSLFLEDWRFWAFALALVMLPAGKPLLGWLWVCVIYQYRLDKRRQRQTLYSDATEATRSSSALR